MLLEFADRDSLLVVLIRGCSNELGELSCVVHFHSCNFVLIFPVEFLASCQFKDDGTKVIYIYVEPIVAIFVIPDVRTSVCFK